MCFSVEADVVAGAVLLPVAAVSLREVRCVHEFPFAALPLVFAVHQLIEALVWARTDGGVSAGVGQAAALAYALIAYALLPGLVPLAVVLLEPHGHRLRVAPFVGLGAVVTVVMAVAVLRGPLQVQEHTHALVYDIGLPHATVWTVLYVLAVIGPSVLSGYPSIVAFGVLNLVGLTVVAVLETQAFASVWCVYAALTSALVLLHMVRRRRLPDAHRLHGRRSPVLTGRE